MNETPTPRTDAETLEFIRLDPSGSYVDAYFACDLERELSAATAACAAKDAALEFVVKHVGNLLDWPGNVSDAVEGITVRCASALSNPAGQELLDELTAAKELLREIRDGEVNAQDEADKFLRDHQPSALSLASARVKALEDALAQDECPKCKGRKGFEDTTYDRTGMWCDCEKCDGTGTVFNLLRLRKALTQPPV